MTFEEYVRAIQALAEADGTTDAGMPYCPPETWRESYEDGLEPDEAWDEERSAWPD